MGAIDETDIKSTNVFDRAFQKTDSYTSLKTYPDMASGHNIWLPGPTGIIPNDTEPPRYEFKHLSEHLVTFDHVEPKKYTDKASDVTLKYSHRFWGEFFGALYLIVDFVISFVLELTGFILKSVSHLLIGILIRISDYFVKPLLVFGYNAFTIPALNYTATLVGAILQILSPILDVVQRLAEIAAIVVSSLRLCEYNKKTEKYLKNHNETQAV